MFDEPRSPTSSTTATFASGTSDGNSWIATPALRSWRYSAREAHAAVLYDPGLQQQRDLHAGAAAAISALTEVDAGRSRRGHQGLDAPCGSPPDRPARVAPVAQVSRITNFAVCVPTRLCLTSGGNSGTSDCGAAQSRRSPQRARSVGDRRQQRAFDA